MVPLWWFVLSGLLIGFWGEIVGFVEVYPLYVLFWIRFAYLVQQLSLNLVFMAVKLLGELNDLFSR